MAHMLVIAPSCGSLDIPICTHVMSQHHHMGVMGLVTHIRDSWSHPFPYMLYSSTVK